MNVREETVSPKRAREYLDKHWVKEHQRTPSPSTVEDYARTMRAGQWMLTHQGIAIDDKNELIDGVHRLLAIEQAGVPVKILVTRGVVSNGTSSKGGLYAIDAIDRGRLRDVGQQLQLRHGYLNGNSVAASAWTIVALACHSAGIDKGRASTAKALHVLDLFGAEIKHCVAQRPTLSGLRNGSVLGTFALAMRAYPADMKAAFDRFATGEGLLRGDPMFTLRNFFLASSKATSGNSQLDRARATAQALHKVVQKESLKCIKSHSENGLAFFVDKQKPTINRLLVVCGYSER